MNVGERIKEIRSNRKLSRRAFGEKLGVSESVIVNIEYNRLKKPEQQEPLYRLICSTFGISYEWLMTGKGSADQNVKKTALNQLMEEHDLDDIDRRILECYIELSESERDNFKQLLKKVAAAVTAGDPDPLSKILPKRQPTQESQIDAEVESYRQELLAEAKGADKSAVSPNSEEAG